MTIAFRAATPDRSMTNSDYDFIVSTWSASYKKAHAAGIIQADDWAAIMSNGYCDHCGARPQIVKILERPGMRAVLAHDTDDTNYFYGWIAGDASQAVPLVAYVYVKEAHRKSGIARGLFAALGVDPGKHFVYACKTGIVTELSSKIPFARFNNNDIRYSKRGL